METNDKRPQEMLDRAAADIRNEPIDSETVRDAADRVWARLAAEAPAAPHEVETIQSCADFQTLIPAWREGKLSQARALLVEDHVHTCPACRRVAEGPRAPIVMRPRRLAPAVWKWAVAASFIVALGFTSYMLYDRLGMPAGERATVASLDGKLYRVAANGDVALVSGAPLADGEAVRTARGSGAVLRLRDGSMVEMRERTQLAVSERRQGATIRLASGSVIVQAAKQHSRHLFVATDDCLVSVTGTIFSVNHGLKGSRVSVVEGEVRVAHGQATDVLHPGDQTETGAALTPVPVREDVAWSRNADQYIAVLGELQKLRAKLEALPGPGLRYSTRLLDLAPEGTVFYAAIPNLGSTLGTAGRLFHEQLQQSEPLRQWWTEKMHSADAEAKLDDALARIETFSGYLGPELAVAFAPDAAGRVQSPVLIAEVAKSGLRDYLAAQVKGAPVSIVDDPAHAASVPGAHLYVYVGPQLVAAAADPAQLARIAAGQSGFAQSPFRARIAQSYTNGVSWLLCADLHTVVATAAKKAPAGFDDMQYLIVERKDVAGQQQNRATLSFAQARRGAASWLAAPAPIRALDFVSADATVAAAALTKNPAALLEDAFGMAAGSDKGFLQHLAEVESRLSVKIREDLAAPLGGEFAFAIDGPMLPVPSWKLVLEVDDPLHFQNALMTLAASANQEAAKHSAAMHFRIDQEQAAGRTYYIVRGTGLPFEVQYTYDGGFLVAAPNRDLILRALELRTTGNTLTRSAQFRSLLPHDGQINFSAAVYHRLGAALGSLSDSSLLTAEQKKSLANVASAAGPVLVLAYGESDRIELASTGSIFGLTLDHLLLGPGSAHRASRPAASPRS